MQNESLSGIHNGRLVKERKNPERISGPNTKIGVGWGVEDLPGQRFLMNVYDFFRIGGWKQWEHPVLHSAFHIGDCVISVSGIRVASASDVHKIIKQEKGLSVSINMQLKL